jgi:serine/threonine protein kinase
VRCPRDQASLLTLGPGHDDIHSEKYVILGRLNKGGMSGGIYRAYKPAMEKEVALKVLSSSDARDRELVERFRREATSTGQLRSPHTVRVYDFGWLESGEPCIEMELLSGTSLETIIQEEAPLAPERVLDLSHQICLSLEEAHARGRVHRDIKPSNIMVERTSAGREHVTVLDFGLVKHVGVGADESIPPPTDPGTRAGTPPYMAPELWSEQYGQIGPGVDIYALGIVIFQMITGKQPFPPASDISRIITHHLYQAPAGLSTFSSDAATIDRFQPIITRCLAKRPEDRFASISELRSMLAPASTSVPAALARMPRRSLSHVYSAGAFLVLAVSLIFGATEVVDRALAYGAGEAEAGSELRIDSAPPGAWVFLDGEPTGLTTPAVVRGLNDDHMHRILLAKRDCAARTGTVTVEDSESRFFLRLDCE